MFNIALEPSLRPSVTPANVCLLTQRVTLVSGTWVTWVKALDGVESTPLGEQLRCVVWASSLPVCCPLQAAFGALGPLLIYSSIDEHWRLSWLSPNGDAPLRPARRTRAVFDVALLLLGTATIYQLCLLAANEMM